MQTRVVASKIGLSLQKRGFYETENERKVDSFILGNRVGVPFCRVCRAAYQRGYFRQVRTHFTGNLLRERRGI